MEFSISVSREYRLHVIKRDLFCQELNKSIIGLVDFVVNLIISCSSWRNDWYAVQIKIIKGENNFWEFARSCECCRNSICTNGVGRAISNLFDHCRRSCG